MIGSSHKPRYWEEERAGAKVGEPSGRKKGLELRLGSLIHTRASMRG